MTPLGQEPPESPEHSVEIRVLSVITVQLAGQRIPIGVAKHRLMLAMLVAAEGRQISTAQLISQIWGDDPPRTARDLIHSYASDLRRSLARGFEGAAQMLPPHHGDGYRLVVGRSGVDLYVFRDLSSRARSLAETDPAQAVALWRQALALWGTGTRGDPGDGPFTDLTNSAVADCQWLKDYRLALREEYRAALIACFETELRLGEHERLIPELADLAAADPLDERIAGLLMIAYYRSGRQAQATRLYQSTRARLSTDLGVEPSQRLKELYHRFLNQDPSLDPPGLEEYAGPPSQRPEHLTRRTAEVANADVSNGQVIVGEIPREPPAFVKRETLAQLANAARSGKAAVVCAVTGLRGVGKTQLAAAYARDRIARGCRLVGWVNAESRDSLLGDLARVATAAGVADPEGDSAESARRLRDHLTVRASESLLVLDNAADPDLLRPFLPAAGSTQVVITSTSHAFTEFGTPVDVSEFSRDESLGYLAIRTGLGDRDGAAAVAEELGDLPLGLAQASAVIAGQRMTYQEYLQRLRQVPVARLLGRLPGGDYPRATAAALLLNVAAAEEEDLLGLTGRLLRVVAVLAAEGAHRRMLDGLSSGDQTAMGAALQRCADQSLLTWSVTGAYVIMHRLLSRVIRERDKASGQLAATREMAMDLLEPQLHPEAQAWARREDGAELAAHIEAVWQTVAGDPAQP
jgi:DNA-binding SARP family transcriptional activator